MNEDKLRDYLRRVTADLHRTRRRLEKAEASRDEPVAIVAVGCRYPGGVRSFEDFWELVSAGRDAISGFPLDRGWDDGERRSGTGYAPTGGFLYDAADFDAAFFGISPREAQAMDPQQRLLLETSWEALERAGVDPTSLRGSRTGVFVGSTGQDYAAVMMGAQDRAAGYLATGSLASVMSGRVSYALGLEGPAVTVDTACSSSLVALHLAVQALRSGECSLALAGGVTVMATPGGFAEFGRQGGLAADGRCKSFAASADGTNWGEGVGMLVVERLADAERLGHPVLAVVRGSAVNQDGASNGLTAPNGPAQQRVIRQALANAGLSAADVDLVEAHGTGTVLGDPIEAQALLSTYGQNRPEDRPLWLGSVKSNLGHTQAAAGVAGLIKVMAAMRHGVVPPTLHVDQPTPEVDWSSGAVRLATEPVTWPEADRPRRAAVSSFGISGTNAHVLLEQAPAPARGTAEPAAPPREVAWVLAGRTAPALEAQAAALAAHLGTRPELDHRDVGFSLAASRAALEHRAVLLGADRESLLRGAVALAAGEAGRGVVRGVAGGAKLAVLFTGQGAQRLGMGRELHASFPVFADAFDEVCEHLDARLGRPLKAVVWGSDADLLDQTVHTQAALFAVEVALFRLVESWGVRPDHVLGHSIGEVVAAHVAGVLSLADASLLVAARGRLMQALPAGGAMVSLEASEAEVVEALAGRRDQVDIAAVNTARSAVISGDEDAVLAVAAEFAARGRKTKRLRVSHAFHSPRMAAMTEEFRQSISGLSFAAPSIPLVSNLTGAPVPVDELCSPEHWVAHVRRTVRFAQGIDHLHADGVGVFLELGPDGVLSAMARDPRADAVAVPAMRADRSETRTLLHAVAELHVHGVGLDRVAAFAGGGALVDLPTYAFQRERYWLAPSAPVVPATDPVDSEFWAAVEREDLEAITTTLAVDGDDPLSTVLPALSSWRRRRRDSTATEPWRYRISWRPVPAPGPAPLPGTWLVIGGNDDEPVGQALVRCGAEVVPVPFVADQDGMVGRVRAALDGHPEIAGVVCLPSAAGPVAPLVLSQALGELGVEAPLWCLTRNAVVAEGTEVDVDPLGAQVWGLGRVLALENPRNWGGLIDLPEEVADGTVADHVASLLAAGGEEDQLAIRAGGLFARRLARAPLPTESPSGDWTPRGTVLITGGTGGLGAHLARWAATEGAEHLVLASRRGGAAPGAAELEAELTASGVGVTTVAVDLANPNSVACLSDALPDDRPLTAVIHAAGVSRTTPTARLSVAEFQESTGAKVLGAAHLEELVGDRTLDAFVLFSSVAGVWGSGGQAAYAAANAHLDALAQRRRLRGAVATSVAWGPWAGAGMVESEAGAEEHLNRRGLTTMAVAPAITALRHAVGHDEAAIVVADVDWSRFTPAFTSARPSPLLVDLPEARTAAPEPTEGSSAARALLSRLAGMSADDQDRVLLEVVRTNAAAVLGHDSMAAVEPGRAFRDSGFDSLTAVELRDLLGEAIGASLPASLVFDYPTPEALARHLRHLVTGDEAEGSARPAAAADGDGDGDPVVIVGMSCRFPGGVNSPEDLWRLLVAGGDAIAPFPADRGWDVDALYDPDPDQPGTSYAREGGFLAGAADFDAGFFGISPREALAMDPQQRLLLETSWEAFERAGIEPAALRGSRSGVFVGTNGQDYVTMLMRSDEPIEGYVATGNAASVIAGRLAYTFGLEGPAVSVDTACSSSLVALHLAVQSLRAGECELAVAAGVTVMSAPGAFVEFSRQRGLAADGRCKAFAGAADGTGWSEGVGVLVVERLSDARRNGHRVLAVVRGSAVNQDGASNGLTAPNGPSQQRVIRQALADARLTPEDVDAVEGHGTGTTLGDPIEAQALLATYGRDRPADRPLWLGSVKSNIGHTQGAAGVAGVIKMVMAMRHGVLPRTLHVDEPTPHVDWASGAVSVLAESRDWPETGGPRRAGVSAFGMSGTNAHLVLERPEPAEALTSRSVPLVVPWVLSGRSARALREQAARLRDHLDNGGGDPVDVGYSLVVSRSVFEHRAVVVGTDRDELVAGLSALAEGGLAADTAPGVVSGVAESRGRRVMVFPGQGSQWWGMATGLATSSTVFTTSFDRCATALAPYVDFSPWAVLRGETDPAVLDRVDVVQPMLFAVMVSLAELWRVHGIEPDAVIGHSQGEIAAAHVAGVLTLEDAARIVALRSRAIAEELSGQGTMASVSAPAETVRGWIGQVCPGEGARVGVAAANGPTATVVSGAVDAVEAVVSDAVARGVRAKVIPVDYASHSEQVEGIRERLARDLAGVVPRRGRVPVFSTVTGRVVDPTTMDGEYWYRGLRGRVVFEDAVRVAAGEGFGVFLEVSPHPVLTMAVEETLDGVGVAEVVVLGSLRRGEDDARQWVRALAQAHVRGVGVDWAPCFTSHGAVVTDLPTYPFQHQRYWPRTRRSTLVDGGEFWAAVEQGDLDSFATRLGIDPAEPFSSALPALTSYRQRYREEAVTDSWRHRVSWRPLAESAVGRPTGTWLVVTSGAEADEWTAVCVDGLKARGVEVVEFEMGGSDRTELAGRLAAETRADGVLTLLPADTAPSPAHPATPAGYAATVRLIQALGDVDLVAPLWCLTRGAVAAVPADRVDAPLQALVWGLGRVTALEHPDRWGGLVDLPDVLDDLALDRLCAALAGLGDEDQLAVRPAGIFARRLERAPRPSSPAAGWTPGGTVLVTGGTGALGSRVARWLADQGAAHLLLVSRRGREAPGAVELAAELAGAGTEVTLAACDIADRDALARLLTTVPAEHPLTGVVHTAATLDDGLVDSLTADQIDGVLSSRTRGTMNLHELTRDLDLSAFVLFSAFAGTAGGAGQGNHAPGTAFLDALAAHRHARGLPATAIAWGPWAEGALPERGTTVGARAQWQGLAALPTPAALTALRQAVDHREPTIAIVDADWSRFASEFTAVRRSRFLVDLLDAGAEDQAAQAGPSLAHRLAELSDGERDLALLDVVRVHIAAVLGYPSSDAVEPTRAVRELGFDSLTAVDLRNRLAVETGLPLPVTLVFNHPSPLALAAHLKAELLQGGTDTAAPILSELERFEAVLAAAQPDRTARARIADRLRELVANWTEEEAQPDGEAVADRLRSATPDEVFDFIDRELGAL
ncbi:polyketide synthase [Actinoalloteichus sp. AHMU CJ021]|uniref:type I polyketide synthase n=1 Tax=Actinoalloteichus sp. AHMU CJ021 TaxID=2072503 RepID=UPI000CA03555|nr:polyketide synthase [Actinoalloteichus sp. AHMU CJ021]